MTNEQMAAAEQIREIADKNNLVVAAIWSAQDVVNYYNENENKLTLEEAEEILFNWEKEIKESAQVNGYHVISMMMDENSDEE